MDEQDRSNEFKTNSKELDISIIKNNPQKYIILVCIIIFILMITGVVIANHNKNVKYNNLISQGNSFFSNEEYDKAIPLYKQALTIKSDNSINKKLTLTEQLNESKKSFDSAINSYNTGAYSDAINSFKNVNQVDTKRYDIAKGKIKECEQIIVKQDIQLAQNEAKNKKYDEACKFLDNALEIQPTNAEVVKLKNEYTQLLEKHQEEELKKQEEEAKKQAEAAAAAEKAEAKANMSKAECGTGVIGIAVVGVKKSKTVDTGYGTYQYFKDKNMQFLWLDIGAINLGAETQHVNPNFFTLSTPDGMTVNYDVNTTFSRSNYFNAIDLPPNGNTSGWLIFGVPKGNEYILHYNDYSGQVDKRIITN